MPTEAANDSLESSRASTCVIAEQTCCVSLERRIGPRVLGSLVWKIRQGEWRIVRTHHKWTTSGVAHMQRKKLIVAAAVLGLTLGATGCGKDDDAADTTDTTDATGTTGTTGTDTTGTTGYGDTTGTGTTTPGADTGTGTTTDPTMPPADTTMPPADTTTPGTTGDTTTPPSTGTTPPPPGG
jgi:hypothetical protein